MTSIYTIPQILQFARISQYLAANDKSKDIAFRSDSLIRRQPSLLYMESELLANINTLNPNSPTLRGTGEYVLSLCGKYLLQAQTILGNLLQNPPIITGPSNQSVAANANATFTISVVSSIGYTIQWYDSVGNPIPGATGLSYVFSNAQVSDSGKTFYAKATNSAGTSTSQTATLTVSASITANWAYVDSDPYPQLSIGNDTLTYQVNQTITHNANIVVTYPLAATNNKYWVLRYPDTENDKTAWNNTPSNFGSIPDSVMRAIFIQNGYKYIVTRNSQSLDASATTLTYS